MIFEPAMVPGMLVIGADLGGTGARASLTDNGHVLAQTELLGVTDRAQTVVDLVTELLARTHLRSVDAIALGATGFAMTGATLREQLPPTLLRLCHRLVLCSDMVTSYLGALGLAPGAVLAVGTGAVALGTDLKGTWSRVDGWGYLVGDLGGGSWIGRQALSAALRCADSRPGGSPVLLQALKDRFGDPADLIALLTSRADRAGVMAGFVPAVKDAAAAAGDVVAQAILTQAGGHLAETAIAALVPGAAGVVGGGVRGGGAVGGGRVVAVTGNLFQAGPALTDSFQAAMTEANVEVQPALGSSVDGALLLATSVLRGKLPPNTPCEQFTSPHK
jgi:N-acetylglucosamine kinase-like BadF-type ATPase